MNSKILKDMLTSNCDKLKAIQISGENLSEYELGLLNAYSHTLNILNLLEQHDLGCQNVNVPI